MSACGECRLRADETGRCHGAYSPLVMQEVAAERPACKAFLEGGTMEQRMWSVDEVAAHLRVHRNTVLRMMQRGELVAQKVGNQWRIAGAEVRRITGR